MEVVDNNGFGRQKRGWKGSAQDRLRPVQSSQLSPFSYSANQLIGGTVRAKVRRDPLSGLSWARAA